MANKMEHDISRILRGMNNQEYPEEEPDQLETLHVYPVEGGILILREDNTVDSDSPIHNEPNEPDLPDVGWLEKNMFPIFILILCFFLCLDSLSFYLPSLLAPTATIAIIPDQQNITLKTDISLTSQLQSRILPTLTITQNKTVQATGRGHQNASYAIGSITFYSGLLTSQTIPVGTVLTGSDGIAVITTQDAFVPAANPPTEGQATVSAHALQIGSQGNIGAKDINKPCCLTSVLAVNFTAFQGGQNARDFTYVTKQDIQNAALIIEKTVSQSLQSALSSEASSEESLVPPTCKPTISSDHQVGDESNSVKVTVSERCNTTAYNTRALRDQAVQAITSHVRQVLGTNYALLGEIQTNILSATQTKITLSIQGVWVYQFTEYQIAHIKQLVQGKSEKEAIRILSSFKGIRKVTVIGISGNIPTDANHIHILILL